MISIFLKLFVVLTILTTSLVFSRTKCLKFQLSGFLLSNKAETTDVSRYNFIISFQCQYNIYLI